MKFVACWIENNSIQRIFRLTERSLKGAFDSRSKDCGGKYEKFQRSAASVVWLNSPRALSLGSLLQLPE